MQVRSFIGVMLLTLISFAEGFCGLLAQSDSDRAARYKLIGVIHSIGDQASEGQVKSGLAIVRSLGSERTYYLRLGDTMLSDQLRLTKIGSNFVELTDINDERDRLQVRFDGSRPSPVAARSDSATMPVVDVDELRSQAEQYLDQQETYQKKDENFDAYEGGEALSEKDTVDWQRNGEVVMEDRVAEDQIMYICADGEEDCDPRD